MDEPSVLDYVKAKIMPWKYQLPELKIDSNINQISENHESLNNEQLSDSFKLMPENDIKIKTNPAIGFKLPPILFLGLIFAILGQIFLEPPDRKIGVGIFLYIVSFGFLLFAAIRKDRVFDREQKIFPGQINIFIDNRGLIALGISFTSLLIAFFAFKETGFHDIRFNFLNLFFWILSFISFCYAILDKSELSASFDGIFNAIKKRQLVYKITPWIFLSLVSIILIIFFRFFRLGQIPGEMFSDHAEKLLDVVDVLNGDYHVFFVRNTGREFIQFYLTTFIAVVFKTGISFLSLKLGTAIAGFLTLPYIYRLGKEIGNRWIGILAFLFAGISYWHNVISRVGLRFPLYPLFAAPALFYLIRGIRQKRRNDFVFAGIALGLGLHGYSSFRLVPIVIVFVVLLYFLHERQKTERTNILFGLIIIIITSFIIFLPLFKFSLISPADVNYRSLTRLGTIERSYSEPVITIFSQNVFNALTMFFYSDGNTWVHSIPFRPALDFITAALYFVGTWIVFIRYLKHRNWEDLFLILLVPLLLLPSILSLAFPEENPSLNRTGGAIIPVFILVAIGFESVFSQMWLQSKNKNAKIITIVISFVIFLTACFNNYDLLFRQYNQQFLAGAWNSSQIGEVVKGFAESIGNIEDAHVVPYPHWVDTRLVGINAGYATKDLALWPEQFASTLDSERAKLFIIKPENIDALSSLQKLYPDGAIYHYDSGREGKDFIILSVPPQVLPESEISNP